jgi:hypothetical protein
MDAEHVRAIRTSKGAPDEFGMNYYACEHSGHFIE